MVLRFLWGKGTHRISWTTLQAPEDKGGMGILGLGELCECFQAALAGRLMLNDTVHACMRAWVSHSTSEQGLPPLQWGLRDHESIVIDSWILNGLIKQSKLSDGLFRSTIPASDISSLPLVGLAQVALAPDGTRQDKPTMSFLGSISDVFDDMGGAVYVQNLKRQGCATKQCFIDNIHAAIPSEWAEIITGSRPHGTVPCLTHPLIINMGVKEAKRVSSLRHQDPVELKWKVHAKDRSGLFLRDLRRASTPLWWFQHFFSIKAYFMGDRVKHFNVDGAVCPCCKSQVASLSHVVFRCYTVEKAWRSWRKKAPRGWKGTPERDQLGMPSEAVYDLLPFPLRKAVVQWLIQGVEIKRTALFNFFSLSKLGASDMAPSRLRVTFTTVAKNPLSPSPPKPLLPQVPDGAHKGTGQSPSPNAPAPPTPSLSPFDDDFPSGESPPKKVVSAEALAWQSISRNFRPTPPNRIPTSARRKAPPSLPTVSSYTRYPSLGCLKLGWNGLLAPWASGWTVDRKDGGDHYNCTVGYGLTSQTHTVNARSGFCSCHGLPLTERAGILYSTPKGKWPQDTLGCPHVELGVCRGWLSSYAIRSAMGTLPAYAAVPKVGATPNKYSRIRLNTEPAATTPITLHPHAWKLNGSQFRFVINMELGICECSNTGIAGNCIHIKDLRHAFPAPSPPPTPPLWSSPLSLGTSSPRRVKFADIAETRWIPDNFALGLLLLDPDSFIRAGGIYFQYMGQLQGKILWQFSEGGNTYLFRPDENFCECDEFDEAPLTNLSCTHLPAFRAKLVETETIVIE